MNTKHGDRINTKHGDRKALEFILYNIFSLITSKEARVRIQKLRKQFQSKDISY